MSQTNVREGYGITTLEVVELVEDLISYLAVAKCTRLRNAQIPKVFHEAAAGTIWTMMLAKVRQYGAKVKTEDLSNMLTLILSKTAQRRSSSVVSNRSTASITDKFGVALLTEPAILNDANVALVDAMHYSVVKQFSMFRLMTKESQQKLEENYFEVMDALTMTLIEDDDDLLGTVNSYIKSRRLRAVMLLCQTMKPPGDSNKDGPPLKRRKTEAADSRHAKASGGRTKKDKDSEDSDTSSDVLRLCRRDRAAARARLAERKRLGKEAQLKKTRDEEELAKAKKEKEEKEAQERKTYSSDIDSEDDSEDEEATTAKDLAREQKERLKALLNAKTRDGLSARVGTAMEHCTLEEWTSAAVFFSGVSCDFILYQLTDAYILYFKELLSNNGGIFANAIGIGKTRAMVLATEVQNARAEGDAIEHNAVDDDDKLYPTKGERTFYCAWGQAADAWKNEVVAIDLANSTWCDLSDLLALQFCFFSNSPLENISRLTKEEAMEMRIDTTDAISKALAAANKLVAPRSYVLGGATKHRPAPLAAQFVIVCGFRKVDKHVFRAYNTMSVTAQRTIIRKGGSHVEKRAILLPSYITVWGRTKAWALSGTPMEQGLNEILIFVSLALISLQNRKGVSNWFNATDKRDSVTGDRIYKIEDAVYWLIAETLSYRTCQNTALNSLAIAKQYEHESSHKYKELISQGAAVAQRFMLKRTLKTRDLDILEKEGLNESEASRRVIFNCFEMQAIASYPALATLKAAQFKTYGSCKVKRFTLNSVKDLFTNLSKDYFLVREARAITKSSLKFQNLSNLCSEVKILGTPSRIWSIAAEDAAKAANTPLLPKEVRAKILIGSYKPIKFGDESVLVMQRGITQHEINLKLAKWRDLDSQLAEMCVGIVYFNLDSELELKVLGKGLTVTDQRMDWHQTKPIVMSLEALC
ncbi:hypothetical protein HBI69_134570 [Parastagonospora nodorum]|nr:hypothetical protein HBI69_134570 [Parastagonospora nodorum]